MRILFVERSLKGHRKVYLECLSSLSDIEAYVYAPISDDNCVYETINYSETSKGLYGYLQWIKSIIKIVEEKKIDVVNFLDGDSIMRFFGIGINKIPASKVIITYHHFFEGVLRKISYRRMNSHKNALSVVHTESVANSLKKYGIKNIAICTYPAFDFESISKLDINESKKSFGVPSGVPTIGIVGGMWQYKKILEFLKILPEIKEKFHLLICGKSCDITETQIRECIAGYEDKSTIVIRKLSDEEYQAAISASDIIFCIYGHEFDGASGPLTDGVCANKMILACKHGSLGQIVTENHLGLVAECDEEQEVLEKTEMAIKTVEDFQYDEKAMSFRSSLSPEHFQKKYLKIYFGVDKMEAQ